MLIFFFVIGMFQNSSYAQSDRKNAKTLCMSAIQGYLPFWDVNDPQAVAQAKRRGLSERQCARLTERFSEQKIRSFKKDIQQKRGPSTNTKQERKNRQLFIDNKKLQKQIKQLKAAQKNLAKKSLGGINQKLKKQEALTDKNTLKIKNIEAISRQILDIKNQNDTILNQIGEWQDVIPRLEKNIKRLTVKVNNSIDTDSGKIFQAKIESQNNTILTQFAEWQDVIPRLERQIKRLASGDLLAVASQPVKTGSPSSSPPAQKPIVTIDEGTFSFPPASSDNLMWIIPILLLVGAFGIIVVVLIRKNSETRRQLEDAMQNAGRKNPRANSDVDNITAKSEDG
jgi:hypothetical protein